jgi:hypothetical protein
MTDLLERTSNKWLTPRITTAVLVLELLIRAREITLLYELIDLKLAAYHITPLDDIVAYVPRSACLTLPNKVNLTACVSSTTCPKQQCAWSSPTKRCSTPPP